ncbi:MAG: type I secretion C-terminal target domain-containing protein, partial [Hyphomicrobium sp.]
TGGGTTGDGGTAGSDTVVFTGNRADYTIEKITFTPVNEAAITAYKITDKVAGRDATDLVVGVENFKFADMTQTAAQLPNAPPVISSNGGGATAALLIAENTSAVTTVLAVDANNVPGDPLNPQTLTYSISGGADAAKFTINPVTGILSFIAAQDFEAPADADTDNVFDVIVQVSDGISIDTQALSVTVQNADEAGAGTLAVGYTVNGANTSVTLIADAGFNDLDLVSDANPLGVAAVTYQWQQSGNNGVTWTNIAGAAGTASSLTPSAVIANSVDRPLHVVATYTDAFGAHSTTSAAFEIGNANANTLAGTAGADTLIGLGGNDLYVVNHASDVTVETAASSTDTIQTSLVNYTLSENFENLQYSNGNGVADDLSFVGTGNAANNTLRGGGAADVLTGGTGDDALFGSGGTDIAVFAGNINNATFGLSGNSAQVSTLLDGTDTLTSMEKVRFAGLEFTLRIGNNNNNDSFVTTAAPELFLGFSGTDTVVYQSNMQVNANLATGTALNGDRYYSIENLTGGSGNDTLTGDGNSNVLSGGDGADKLTGAGGNDTLNGGAGFDTIVFAAGFGNDTVNGFDSDAGGGQDKLDVSGFTGGDDITAANYLSFMTITGGGTTTIVIDSNGAAAGGFLGQITLNGVNSATINQTDFVF